MKRLIKFTALTVLFAGFDLFSGHSIRAQSSLEQCNKIYQRFLKDRTGTGIPEWTAAIATGKEYLQKCSSLSDQDEVKNYVSGQIPKLENKIAQKKIADMEERFNAELKANNADGLIASAKDLINLGRPYSLDLMLDIASVGFDKAAENPPVDKYNGDAITYAKMALQKMSEGKTSGNTDKYGFYAEYKTKDCTDGKINATGWMNYTIGYITFARLKQTKDAVPYLYKSTQVGCGTKSFSEAYRMIGAWYLDEIIKLNIRYKEITTANGGKENDESLAVYAMIKGHAERALDAYARAYKIASTNPKATQLYKDGLIKRVKEMYGLRNETDLLNVDDYVATAFDKPFTDPTVPVSSVK